MFIRNLLKKHAPPFVKKIIQKLRAFSFNAKVIYYFILQSIVRPYKIKKLIKKDKIKVAFFLQDITIWKYDILYELLVQNKKYEAIIFVIPFINLNEQLQKTLLQNTFQQCLQRGYKVINSFDQTTHSWIDIKSIFNPDIIIFTNPHFSTLDKYYISNFKFRLNLYAQYAFHVSNLNKIQYNQLFHNLLWKQFCETKMHQKFAAENSFIGKFNTIYTGYPGTWKFITPDKTIPSPWKINNKSVIKIIWAPHHTIFPNDSGLAYSNFLQYAKDIKEFITHNKYIHIAFKPHPLLRNKLYMHPDWGVIKTNNYYEFWKNLENGQLEEGEYHNLFNFSDALIFDSGSFVAEYLYVNKPSIFCWRDDHIPERFNDFGKLALNIHQKAQNFDDIKKFIENVCQKIDPKITERKQFYYHWLIPPNNQSPSENIFDFLNKTFKITPTK